MSETLLTPEEVAAALRVEVPTVRAWFRTGVLRAVKVGREWRMAQSELDRYLESLMEADDEDEPHNDETASGLD